MTLPSSKRAFSLVELSIALVILGLLAGGVLSGQSLIRAAEMRSVSTDLARYGAAVYTFRDKYFGLPGDITNAEAFWGTDPDGCPTHSNRVAKKATCNGNGDGILAPDSGEPYRFWQQLANAGLVEGSYTGVTGADNAGDADAGSNVPKLHFGASNGVSILYMGSIAPYAQTVAAGAYMFPGNYGNIFAAGFCGGRECADVAFKPEEAWNIDTKLDDGKPGTGKIMSRMHTHCTNAVDGTLAVANAATYDFTTAGGMCTLYYNYGF